MGKGGSERICGNRRVTSDLNFTVFEKQKQRQPRGKLILPHIPSFDNVLICMYIDRRVNETDVTKISEIVVPAGLS